MEMKEVIIAGGTGLIGTGLTRLLLSKGYRVNILSRSARKSDITGLQYFKWDIPDQELPLDIFGSADYVINLSGASVGEKRWNAAYKKEILESRVNSTRLLVETINTHPNHINALLNGSAIGYYGMNLDHPAGENDPPGDDFMAEVCVAWENEAQKLDQTKTRLLISRTGIVFSAREGALHSMAKPVKYFVGAPLGTGTQVVSWIHVDDLCRGILFALENQSFNGVFNAVAPNPSTNKEITNILAEVLNKPLFLPPVPGFILKMILGEFAESVLGSAPVSCKKILDAGFEFRHPDLMGAIADLYRKKAG
jgi:uncharacterized protein